MNLSQDEFVGLNRSMDEFRRWVLSDWKSPTTRASLAEYYVRCALGRDNEPAQDWEYVDIVLEDGGKIEVKASAYLQPVRGRKLRLTSPRFDIKEKTLAWSSKLSDWKRSEEPKRWADCYVFCLENMDDPATYNPLDLSQWEFFVVSTCRINETFGHQKSVAIGRLRQEGFRSVVFSGLGPEISRVLQS
ncbi:MAG: hypothetical protein OXC26_10275 [Albidovulum sp.]|nr:hypothetical protein [Albidovulum sp.]